MAWINCERDALVDPLKKNQRRNKVLRWVFTVAISSRWPLTPNAQSHGGVRRRAASQ
jgi:hypothetical protein